VNSLDRHNTIGKPGLFTAARSRADRLPARLASDRCTVSAETPNTHAPRLPCDKLPKSAADGNQGACLILLTPSLDALPGNAVTARLADRRVVGCDGRRRLAEGIVRQIVSVMSDPDEHPDCCLSVRWYRPPKRSSTVTGIVIVAIGPCPTPCYPRSFSGIRIASRTTALGGQRARLARHCQTDCALYFLSPA